jgi:hypothetical protein
MSRARRRKCLHCGELFQPDARNRHHQRYCSEVPCRRASKAASQRRWLAQPQNRDYFRGAEQVERVRCWRERHPGYGRRKRPISDAALQDHCNTQPIEPTEEIATLAESALQDLLLAQPFVLIGLIANLTGSTLQDDIARSGQRLQQLGRDILATGDAHDTRVTLPRTAPPDSVSVQLD